MKLFSILGNSQRLDGRAMRGKAPAALWLRWTAPDDQYRIQRACRCLLLTAQERRNVLFDTGMGLLFESALREHHGVVESQHVLQGAVSYAARGTC